MLLEYVRGVITLEVSGAAPYELLDLMAAQSVDFWGVVRRDEFSYRMRMFPRDFKKLRPLVRRSMCRVHIAARWGLPFKLRKLKRRKALAAGLLLALTLCWVLPGFVWTMEVRGNVSVPSEQILRELAEIGVRPGIYGRSIDAQDAENKMLLQIPELSFLTVNVSGGRAVVEVRERIPTPELVREDEVRNLVAGHTGVITRMEIMQGESLVKVGQTVLEGELLVSGVMDRPMGTQTVRADGEIYARTWRKMTGVIQLGGNKTAYAEREKENLWVQIGQNRINLYFNSGISYGEYGKITHSRQLVLPGGVSLPVYLRGDVYHKLAGVPGGLEAGEAEELLLGGMLEAMRSQLSVGEILKTDYKTELAGELLTITMTCECSEQIAKAAPVYIGGREP